jgi:pantoate kinase
MERVISACAFAPAHITGFFVIFQDGSTGAGVNLAKGAETTVSVQDTRGDIEVVINGVDTEALVSRRVAAAYGEFIAQRRIRVATTTAFPVGYGFGMSGAGSFSLSLALNEALDASKSYRECMQIAADAEIACGTGLGTVMTQQFSGFLIGEEPYPSRAARQIACSEDTVVCCFLDPIETSSIIRDRSWKERINAIGLECMVEINRTPTVARFRELSRYFTFATGLASEPVRRIMEEVKSASMAMLGQTLYAVVHRSEAPEIEARFRSFTDRTTTTTLGDRAAMVVQARKLIS